MVNSCVAMTKRDIQLLEDVNNFGAKDCANLNAINKISTLMYKTTEVPEKNILTYGMVGTNCMKAMCNSLIFDSTNNPRFQLLKACYLRWIKEYQNCKSCTAILTRNNRLRFLPSSLSFKKCNNTSCPIYPGNAELRNLSKCYCSECNEWSSASR